MVVYDLDSPIAPMVVYSLPVSGLPLSAQEQQTSSSSVLMGSALPPPSTSAALAVKKAPAPIGGFWTQRGLPGFTLRIPPDKIKNKRPDAIGDSKSFTKRSPKTSPKRRRRSSLQAVQELKQELMPMNIEDDTGSTVQPTTSTVSTDWGEEPLAC